MGDWCRWVSILVLLDEGCRQHTDIAHGLTRERFQSLFSWMKVADRHCSLSLSDLIWVSILVLLDEGCRLGRLTPQ